MGWLLWLGACATVPPTPAAAPPPAPGSPADALDAFYQNYSVTLPEVPPSPAWPDAVDTLLFASCLQPYKPAPILEAMQATKADLFVMLGDNVYGDARGGDMRLPELREAYATLAAHEEFANLVGAIPVVATWDDHDYGMNDAGASFSARRFAERIFETFWRVPNDDPRRQREGVYGVQTFGAEGRRVQLVLLDLRSFKDNFDPSPTPNQPGTERYVPSDDATRTLLGPTQWAWLAETLAAPADLRVVISSLQVHADGHGYERWGLFPAERDRFYEALAARAGGEVVLVSGDRHRAGIYARPDLAGGPYPELTTSSLNLSFGGNEEAGPHRLGPTFVDENFGTMTIDWTGRTVGLAVHDAKGNVVLDHSATLGTP
ncbi:MAG: alkaline phosphatase D family protein [Myxococcota bacterium]